MIELKSVYKTWDGGRSHTVKDVSLTVQSGSTLALLGGSGSGKSTIVKMINRLVEPSQGSIKINGEEITTVDPVLLRRRIGYVFQGIGLFPQMTVRENIAVVGRLQGKGHELSEARIDELLDLVQLPPDKFRGRYPHEMSGGQRQRVGFARAVATNSRIMLLDEPFGALDPVTRDDLQQQFLILQRTLGLTAVIVTHDMSEALFLADTIAVLHHGELLRIGTGRDLLSNPGHEYVRLMLDTPRRHAEQLYQLMNNPG
jgi:osmoprotectant transport system ATP-binding protein